jgi:hypothetical protein
MKREQNGRREKGLPNLDLAISAARVRRGGAGILTAFSEILWGVENCGGGFYFHPSDEDLSLHPRSKKPLLGARPLGNPDRKNTLGSCGFALHHFRRCHRSEGYDIILLTMGN